MALQTHRHRRQAKRRLFALCGCAWLLMLCANCYVDLRPLPTCEEQPWADHCQEPSKPRDAAPPPPPETRPRDIPPRPGCGDAICDAHREGCSICPRDCPCPQGSFCQQNQCQPHARCGDGRCDATAGESCASCPVDCRCPQGQSCRQGQCLQQCICTPGQKRCNGQSVERCEESGLSWSVLATCLPASDFVCEPTTYSCQCKQTCNPGDKARCISKAELEECISNGPCSSWQKRPCGAEESCKDGKCCSCKPGEKRCNGQTYDQTCGADCKWEKKRSCQKHGGLGVCLGDECI